MPSSNRLLVVAGALTPFTEQSPIATLTRSLPEAVQDTGSFDVRIMMPCYGSINERKHNLHEVIRLSDTDVPMGAETESVTVKVASVPETNLQVYFMDHDDYFGGDGLATIDDGEAPEDLTHRALFFNRSVLETVRQLRWGPDLIHSFGWMSSFTPSLLETTYSEDELFASTRSVFTPSVDDPGTKVSNAFAERMKLPLDGTTGASLSEIGHSYADTTILPPNKPSTNGKPSFHADSDSQTDQVVSLYDQMIGEVPT